VVERTGGLQFGDRSRAAVGVDRNAIESVAFEDVGVDRAVRKNGEAVQFGFAWDIPSWVVRPDLKFLRAGLEAQNVAGEGIGDIGCPIAGLCRGHRV
jgi:hypothetical protein